MTSPAIPEQTSVLDVAVTDPDDDLLGIAPYAQRLADFVAALQPPFTIGVYGAWGSGKTTFVRFVKAFLERKLDNVRFITFEAWPFKTSDDLWRALVQAIAHALYEIDGTEEEPPPKDQGPDPSERFTTRIGKRLRQPAFYLSRERPKPRKNAAYYELLERLDQTLYGGARRPKADGRLLDEDGAMVALVQGTVAALGSLSPLVATMRAFFGFEKKVDVAQLLQQEKNETTRHRIESVAQFRAVLKDLFDTRAEGLRVCVFIDDLDRCMPDVALDLLEALKIFLGDARCVFIVAADEQLIGEGLRIRYKELLQIDPTGEAIRLFARKGKEYFEKIIQLGIRVPDHSSGEVHKFIAAQFPQWLPATDLIQTGVGTNPRRLKQYCTWLAYKYLVAREADAEDETLNPRLLHKLIEMQSWSPEAVRKVCELTGVAELPSILERLEACLRASEPDKPRETAESEIADELAYEIYGEAVMSAPLGRLLTAEPLLSTTPAEDVRALLNFIDAVPSPESTSMLHSRDRVFMRILEKVTKTGELSPMKLLLDDLTKLFALEAEDPAIAPLLVELAQRDDWHEQLEDVEATAQTGVVGSNALFDPTLSSLDTLMKEKEGVRRLLLDAPRLSTILPEIVVVWNEVRGSVPADQLPPAGRAALALEAMPQTPAIEAALDLRVRAARHFVELRKFVKLDSLAYSWPEFAQYVRTDMAGVRAFESGVVDPQPDAQDLPDHWKKFLQDERLTAFLRLRPLLRDIYADELGTFLKLSESVVATPEVTAPTSTPEPSVATPAAPISVAPTPAPTPTPVITPTLPTREYSNVFVEIDWTAGIDVPCVVSLRFDEGPSETATTSSILQVKEIIGRLPSNETSRREAGAMLFDWIFPDPFRKRINEILQGGTQQRFVLSLPSALMGLPWETLYAPSLRLSLGLSRKYPIVRLVGPPVSAPVRLFTPPLRISAIFVDLEKKGPQSPYATQMDRALGVAVKRGLITPDFSLGSTKLDELDRVLAIQRPHIFHFQGSGYSDAGGKTGIYLQAPAEDSTFVDAVNLAELLRENGVILSVLTVTRFFGDGDPGRLALELTRGGVPTVIGTTRPVPDDALVLFTRDFYRALAEGFSIEGALADARRAQHLSQSSERADWAAFALFSSGANLDDLRIDVAHSSG